MVNNTWVKRIGLILLIIVAIPASGCANRSTAQDNDPESREILKDEIIQSIHETIQKDEDGPFTEAAPTVIPTPSPTANPTPSPLPIPIASLSTYTPYQGQVMGFTLLHPLPNADYELVDSHFNKPIIPFYIDGKRVALVPIAAATSTGLHTLSLVEIINGEKRIVEDLTYTVQAVDFTRQNLTPTTEMSALNTNENARSDRQKREAATSATSPVPLWEGMFVQPVEGIITTDFGQMRYTNGNFTSRHSAFDIDAEEGDEVVSAAGGRIVLAEDLILSGKAVIIDHGLWLFTYYYHLSEINVRVGDEVKAGDIIGKVGSTGYSTGPHLHYATSVKNDYINPDMLKERNPLE